MHTEMCFDLEFGNWFLKINALMHILFTQVHVHVHYGQREKNIILDQKIRWTGSELIIFTTNH